jgi:prepilin-type N-terminal cleavage/methylation domain-containing protein
MRTASMRSHRRNEWNEGFTLIEVIIVIAILAIVAGAMAPLASRAIDSSRQDLTVKRQQLIYQAIMGDSLTSGSGFVSDIGRLPNANLTELSLIGSLPSYAIQPCGIGVGWRGPYLLEGIDASGHPLDGWGAPMDFVNGQIRSAGLDRDINTAADNILYPANPISANNIGGRVVLTVMTLDSSSSQPVYTPSAGQASLYFAQNGALQTIVLNSITGSYTYPPAGSVLPKGIYAIAATRDPDGSGPLPALTRTITAYCPGGGTVQQTLALR